MASVKQPQRELLAEIERLRLRLEEAEDTLRAIGSGAVDAFVVTSPDGEQQVYTLKGAEQPYRILVESMNEGAATLAADGTILYCNKRLSAMLKIPLGSLIGTKLGGYVDAKYYHTYAALLDNCTQESQSEEITLTTAGGNSMPVYMSCCANDISYTQGISVVVTDLTLQHRNAEILATEKFSTSIIEQSSEAMIVCDAKGKIIRASQSAHALCGTNPLLKPFNQVFPLQFTESGKKFSLKQYMRSSKVTSIEVEFKRDNKQIINLLLNASNLKNHQNHDIGSVITLSDISSRKAAEMELQLSEIRLQSAYSHLQIVNEELQVASEELQAQSNELHNQNQELQRRKKKLADIYASMSEGLALHEIVYDDTGKAADYLITDVNPAFESITGLERSRAIGKKASELFGTSEAPYLDTYAMIAATGESTTFEVHFVPMNKHFHISAFSPNKGTFATIFQDISDRKRMEDELLKSNAFNQSIIDSSNDCIKILDMDGRLQFMSLPGQRLLEINDLKPYLYVPYADFWKGSDNVRVTEVLKKAKLGQRGSFQGFCPTAKGTPKWWDVDISPVLGTDGKPERLLAVSRDITDRKQAEEELRIIHAELESRIEERTSDLAKTIDILVEEIHERQIAELNLKRLNRLYAVLSETNQTIVKISDRDSLFRDFCRIAVEHGGFVLSWIGLVDEQSGKVNIAAASGVTGYLDDIRISLKKEPEGGGPTSISIREGSYFICNDFQNDPCTRPWHDRGKKYGIRASASIAIKEHNRVIGALTLYGGEKDYFDDQQVELLLQMGMDISFALDNLNRENSRKEAENALYEETLERLKTVETLREKEQILLQQNRQAAMGEMIGNIAHQWRQPLNTLGLYTQMLGTFYGSPNFNKEFLDNSIAKSLEIIKHMSRTIDDFRDYFKPEKEKTDFYVLGAIKNTLSLLEGNFNNPKITIDLAEHDNPVINGYQNEFAQVFLNILNNARDAMIDQEIADGRIIITICTEDNCAVVTVADNAGGIPEEILDKIFDPYFTTKGPQAGTGIGLFMSKTIIEKNMGGRLTVRNSDSGAEFRIEVEHGTQNR